MTNIIPKSFQINRDAQATIDGFYYQILWTLKLWLEKQNDEFEIYCETDEDLKLIEYVGGLKKLSYIQLKLYSLRNTFSLSKSNELSKVLFSFYSVYLKSHIDSPNIEYRLQTNSTFKSGKGIKKSYKRWLGNQPLSEGENIEVTNAVKSILIAVSTSMIDKKIRSIDNKKSAGELSEEIRQRKSILRKDLSDYIDLINEIDGDFINSIKWCFENKSKDDEISIIKEKIIELLTPLQSRKSSNLFHRLFYEVLVKSRNEIIEERKLDKELLISIISDSDEKIEADIEKINSKLSDLFPKNTPQNIELWRLIQNEIDEISKRVSKLEDVVEVHEEKISENERKLKIISDRISTKYLLHYDFNLDLPDRQRARLKELYYQGAKATFAHIGADLDIERASVLQAIKELFYENQTVIIHGASGQGKTSIAYRYIKNNPEILSFELKLAHFQTPKSEINSEIQHILEKRPESEVLIYLDFDRLHDSWFDLIQYYSYEERLKFLVTLREEDWSQLRTISAEMITFADYRLQFNKNEAQNIYQKLSEVIEEPRFSSFEELWEQFGESGPLLEFVYLITQGQSLKARLHNQLNNINDLLDQELAEDCLNILRYISTADTFDSALDKSSLKKKLDLSDRKFERILSKLSEEYLIKEVETTIKGLHFIRSKIMFELFFEDSDSKVFTETNSVSSYVNNIIEILNQEYIYQFLLHFYNKYFNTSEASETNNFIYHFKPVQWAQIGAISKALIWYGIKLYILENEVHIDSLYSRFYDGWSLIGQVFDFTGLTDDHQSDAKFEESIQRFCKSIREQFSHKENVFNIFLEWHRQGPLVNIQPPRTSSDAQGLGEYLFWLNLIDQDFPGQFQYSLETLFQSCTLESLSILVLGYKINSAELYEHILSYQDCLIHRICNKYNITSLQNKESEVEVEFFINSDLEYFINERNISTENQVHTLTLLLLDLLRKIYPDKERYVIQGFIEENHEHKALNEAYKNILAQQLPFSYLLWLNTTFIKLASNKYRPQNWTEYINRIYSFRNRAMEFINLLKMPFRRYFEYGRQLSIAKFVELEDRKKRFSNSYPQLPQSVIDPFGLLSETTSESAQIALSFDANLIVLSLERYKELISNLKKYNWGVIASASTILRYASQELSNGSTSEKNRLIQLTKDNLSDLLDAITSFHNYFHSFFEEHIDSLHEENIYQSEIRELMSIQHVWNEYLVSRGYQ